MTATRDTFTVPPMRTPAHYPGAVYDSPELRRARKTVRSLNDARAKVDALLLEQEAALRAAFEAHPDLGPTALAREIGVSEGTLRGYTRDLARARKQAKKESD